MGFIGIDRGLRDHWIYQDSEYLKVWMEMLFLARFSEEPHTELIDGDIIKVEYGQFIFGRIKWSQRLRIGEQRLRTLMTKLKKEQMIELVLEHRKCSVYALVNYAKFNHETNHQRDYIQQGIMDDTNHQTNHLLTISQPSVNHQSTTKEQSKQRNKVNKVNKEIIYTSDFDIFWDCYPKQIGKPAAFNNWTKLIKTIDPDYLKACAMNYSSYVMANNTELQFIKQPNNFLNAKEEYYKQFESPVLIHNKGKQQNGRMSSFEKLQQMAREEEQREASGHY